MSHEKTVTFESGGLHYMVPSVIGGVEHTPKEAVDLWFAGKNPEFGVFPTQQAADFQAINRSRGGHLSTLARMLMQGEDNDAFKNR